MDRTAREHPEPADPLRRPFEVDVHRVLSSTAFRRLEHKTQVFAPERHDHFRTRMTHTLEAAEVAACIARNAGVDETLARAITLAHDLGHPPFGHAGEAALDACMQGHGGFNHNAHTLRVVTYLEHPYPQFRGLNLTRATLDGLARHETQYDLPAAGQREPGAGNREQDGLPFADCQLPIEQGRVREHSLQPAPAQGVHPPNRQSEIGNGQFHEAVIASLADRIAYNLHDLEDAIGAGLVGLDDARSLRLWQDAEERAVGRRAATKPAGVGAGPSTLFAIRRPVLDAVLAALVTDVTGREDPAPAPSGSASPSRHGFEPPLMFSARVEAALRELEAFLLERVYRAPDIAASDARGQAMIRDLFAAYLRNPGLLPPRFAARIEEQGPHRVICDYTAGMTDRFCIAEHGRICGGG